MKFTPSFIAASLTAALLATAPAQADGLKYYADYNATLAATSQAETKRFSEELGVDFTQWPQPWETQIRNAVTNAGGSDRSKGVIGGREYWVPFDKIPGEESFPMQRRLNLVAQRGYQRAIIYNLVESEKMLAEYKAQNAAIMDKYKKESEESLNSVLAGLKASQDRIAADKRKRQALKRMRDYYEAECETYFPDDVGGCGTLAYSIVKGSSLHKVPPLKASPDGAKVKPTDVYITTVDGRLVARMDANYWVGWFKYDDVTSDVVVLTPVSQPVLGGR